MARKGGQKQKNRQLRAKKRRRKQESRQSDEALTSVVTATSNVIDQHLASPWFLDNLQQRFHWHTLFTRAMEAASSITQRNIRVDLFNTYLVLGARWFSHHESIEMLVQSGRYGDCMVLLRSLLEDTDLMTYFAYYPEEAAEWQQLLSREPIWSDRLYQGGIRRFRMPVIWQKLKAKGIEPAGERDYRVLSSTVHASPWGARFYGRPSRGDPTLLQLRLDPVYDSVADFSVELVLQATYPRPIQAFLTACVAANAPKSQWRSIKGRYEALIDGWETKMELDSWFKSEVSGAEERISRGEDREAVFQDLEEAFSDKFGNHTAECTEDAIPHPK